MAKSNRSRQLLVAGALTAIAAGYFVLQLGYAALYPWLFLAAALPSCLCALGGASYSVTVPSSVAFSLALCGFSIFFNSLTGFPAPFDYRSYFLVLAVIALVNLSTGILITALWQWHLRRQQRVASDR